ncbi:NUDIX hydrolase [Latilactobacillus curvatus]
MNPFTLTSLIPLRPDRWLTYYEATYQNEHGDLMPYHFVSRDSNLTIETLKRPANASAVAMFCYNQNHSQVLLTKQFRQPLNDFVYGNPAGLVEPTESIEQAISRELMEETGYSLIEVEHCFAPSYSSPGLTDGAVSLAICTLDQAKQTDRTLEVDEALSTLWVNRAEAQTILANKKMTGRTQILLWQWANEQ